MVKRVCALIVLCLLTAGCCESDNKEFRSFESRCLARGGAVFMDWPAKRSIYSFKCLIEVPVTWPREYRYDGTFLVTIGLP